MPTSTRPQSRTLSRRSVLKRGAVAAAAGATAPVFSGLAGPLTAGASAAALPMVTPKWSQLALESFGVCAMPMYNHSVYQYRSAWIGSLDSIGVSFIRGTYKNGFAPTYETAGLLRQRGMKWGMVLITDIRQSEADIRARVNDIANRAADVCLYVEGINEPNHNRDGSHVVSDWRQRTLQQQKVLWQAVQARPELRGKPVLGPSLQMVKATEADFKWFADHGLLNYMTHAGSHCYPGGGYIDRKFESLLKAMRTHWKKPVWITETGYTNAVAGSTGPSPVPEWVAGVYAPSAVLEAIDRGWKVNWFEVLDDPDAGEKNDVEANYGLFAVQNGLAPPWRAKPAAVALRNVLTSMKDSGPVHRPAAMGLRVTASTNDVRWTALGKRDGSVRLYLRRTVDVYDPRSKARRSVPNASVTITTTKGSRTVAVGPEVVSVLL